MFGPGYNKNNVNRHGAVLVESAVVSLVVFLVLLTGLDLTLATLRYNSLGEAARRAARAAIVRGETSDANAWGPETESCTADDDSPLAELIRPTLIGMSPEEVTVTAEWLDGTNEIGAGVRVQVTFEHQLLFIGMGGTVLPLTGTSVMQVVH